MADQVENLNSLIKTSKDDTEIKTKLAVLCNRVMGELDLMKVKAAVL